MEAKKCEKCGEKAKFHCKMVPWKYKYYAGNGNPKGQKPINVFVCYNSKCQYYYEMQYGK